MNMTRLLNARRMTFLALASLVAVAGTASALPLALPGIDQRLDTPAGSVQASYHESAHACIDARTPALPAVPVPALPVPVAVPAVPNVSGNAATCLDAGLDGVKADLDADAMGLKAGTGADVDTSKQHDTVKQTAGGLKGFLEGIASSIASWF